MWESLAWLQNLAEIENWLLLLFSHSIKLLSIDQILSKIATVADYFSILNSEFRYCNPAFKFGNISFNLHIYK